MTIPRLRAGLIVLWTLSQLPAGAVIGTSSLRRQAQLKHRRPDLEVVSIRGNVDTRLAKMRAGQVDATLLAVAGLKRLGRADEIDHCLTPDEMLPAVGQGAIGLEVRADDARTAAYLAALDHRETALCVNAERACLEVLDGSCHTPIAAFAELQDGGQALRLRALVALPDGEDLWQDEAQGPADAPVELGRAVGTALRAAAGPEFFRRLAES